MYNPDVIIMAVKVIGPVEKKEVMDLLHQNEQEFLKMVHLASYTLQMKIQMQIWYC